MALKAVVDSNSFESLDESIKGLYVKKDDESYALDVEGFEQNATTNKGQEEKMHSLLAQNKKKEQAAREAQERAAELQSRLDKIAEQKALESGNFSEVIEAEKRKSRAMEEELNRVRRQYEEEKERMMLDSAVSSISAKLFGDKADILAPSLKSRLKVINIEDKRSVGVLDDKGELSSMSLNDFEQYIKTDSKYSQFITASVASGGSSKGSVGPIKAGKIDTSKYSPEDKIRLAMQSSKK